jgi:hypothetical protein
MARISSAGEERLISFQDLFKMVCYCLLSAGIKAFVRASINTARALLHSAQMPSTRYRLKNSGRRVPNRTGLEQKNVGQKNQALQVERYFSARHFSAAPNF